MNKDELHTILTAHREWLNDPQTGEKADLRGADLRGADLSESDLRDADLWSADLRGADLWSADLRGAILAIGNRKVVPTISS